MEYQIFKMPPVGRFGKQRIGRDWLEKINKRAQRLEQAAKPKEARQTDDRQLKLPYVGSRHTGLDTKSHKRNK